MTPDAPTDTAVAFARALRGTGLDVPVGSVTAYVEALDAVGVERTQNLYWAGRVTLLESGGAAPAGLEATLAAHVTGPAAVSARLAAVATAESLGDALRARAA